MMKQAPKIGDNISAVKREPSCTYRGDWWLIALIKSFIFNTLRIFIVKYIRKQNKTLGKSYFYTCFETWNCGLLHGA